MRAKRRHHKSRMKSKAVFIAGHIWRYLDGDTKNQHVVDGMRKRADYLKVCSCEMCRNPRRSKWRRAKGRTRKELQSELELKEQTK